MHGWSEAIVFSAEDSLREMPAVILMPRNPISIIKRRTESWENDYLSENQNIGVIYKKN